MPWFAHPLTFARRQRSRLRKYFERRGIRLDAADIGEALRRFGSVGTPALMVHSSLSACGNIAGGAGTVVDSIRAWAGSATVAMPTHSYCYPAEGAVAPCFDPLFTPSVVGAITNCFRLQPGVVRSLHPTHSLACAGSLAADICANHEWAETPCGIGTPYDRLIGLDCAVLMFGATLNSYTFFHTAEDTASVPYLYRPRRCELTYRDSADVQWFMFAFRHDMTVQRRFAAMDAWFEQRVLLRRERLGCGELLFIPSAAAAHRVLVEELQRAPWFLVAESARPANVEREPSARLSHA